MHMLRGVLQEAISFVLIFDGIDRERLKDK